MKKFIEQFVTPKVLLVGVLICLTGCGVTRTKYQREYAKVWKEYIKSQAWKESFIVNNANKKNDLYVSTEGEVTLAKDEKKIAGFEDIYQGLVSKAYFKIITEAEKADAQITAEYELLQNERLSSKTNKKRVQEITKRYEAHKAMLSGLKSWNIFSDDRSGDLKYFKAENEVEIQKMIQAGESDNQIVNYLIYKLADLYHVEGN